MKRIMIVDDTVDVGRMLQEALRVTYPAVTVQMVPSAEEALLESMRLTFDLLITDLRLPGMSGLELIRKIRVRQPQIKVMLITGLSPEDRLWKQKEDVALDVFLRKPISANTFLDAVASLGLDDPLKGAALDISPGKIASKEEILQQVSAVLPGEPAPVSSSKAKTTRKLSARADTDADEGLSGILSRLRGTLNAFSAMLLDENGHPVAQAGDIPDPTLQSQLIPPILSALSAGAKVSYVLGQADTQAAQASVQAYQGPQMDLVSAPVGQYVLLIALRTGRSALRLALAFEEVLAAEAEISACLEGMGLHMRTTFEASAPERFLAEMNQTTAREGETIPPEVLESPLGQDLGLEKFEELFSRKKTGQLRMEDPDAFWNVEAKEENPDNSPPGMLTFEQAQKLGLLPEDE